MKYELGKVCSRLSSGKRIPASQVSDSGEYPVYGGNGLRGYTDHTNFEGECAIIGRQGAFCGNVRFFSGKAYMTEHAVVVCTNEQTSTRYLAYLLSIMNLGRLSGQSAQPGLSVKTLAKQEIELPALEQQKKIVSILASLDDKIEQNQKLNDNLLQQAQALYKSWFVDFEPFDGVRPSDWNIGEIKDLAQEIVCGKTPSTKIAEYYGSDIPFITIPDMHGNTYALMTERYLSTLGANSQAKKMLPKNSVCVSCIGTAGLVALVASESQTNQQINSIIPKDEYSPFYIYLLMQTLSEVINKLGQSGSTIVNLNKAQFGKIQITVPSVSSMKDFDNAISPLFALILENQKENICLSSLREALLPKLMSGEIDVSDIQL
jgi:type I restriction enzyme S subunit